MPYGRDSPSRRVRRMCRENRRRTHRWTRTAAAGFASIRLVGSNGAFNLRLVFQRQSVILVFGVLAIAQVCQSEQRVLVTLDLDFADIRLPARGESQGHRAAAFSARQERRARHHPPASGIAPERAYRTATVDCRREPDTNQRRDTGARLTRRMVLTAASRWVFESLAASLASLLSRRR
jgi:hypothetical protein